MTQRSGFKGRLESTRRRCRAPHRIERDRCIRVCERTSTGFTSREFSLFPIRVRARLQHDCKGGSSKSCCSCRQNVRIKLLVSQTRALQRMDACTPSGRINTPAVVGHVRLDMAKSRQEFRKAMSTQERVGQTENPKPNPWHGSVSP